MVPNLNGSGQDGRVDWFGKMAELNSLLIGLAKMVLAELIGFVKMAWIGLE